MNLSDRFCLNKPDVILESFDDEIVVVNLASGNYYSIDTLGAEIWAMIQKGLNAEEIIAQLTEAYDGSIETIRTAVLEFLRNIISENLIVPDPKAASPKERINSDVTATRKSFSPPVLHKFTDMQELLLVDPIHEVDETGWPNIPLSPPDSKSGNS